MKDRGYCEDLEVDEKITLALISHKQTGRVST
jgi:hypothetical protein